MSEEVKQFFEEFSKAVGQMEEEMPDMVSGFGGLFAKVMKEGALDLKCKELIALAVGLAVRCKPCIYSHTQKALQAGASREQILEAASVVVMMGGGPAYTHVPEVMKALDELGGGR